jgi:predicted nucleotidyltransferase
VSDRTLEERLTIKIRRKKGDVFLRSDFERTGAYDQVGRALSSLVRKGRLARIGHGIYARATPSILDGTAIAAKGIEQLAEEALSRLGRQTSLSLRVGVDRDKSVAQHKGRSLVAIGMRVRRKIGIGGKVLSIGRSKMEQSQAVPLLSRPVGRRAAKLIRSEPALGRLVDLARERVSAKQVWLFGSRARGDARADSDWDIFLILPDEAPERDLDPATTWRIGRDAGLVADVVADREEDVHAAVDLVNTLAFVVPREGVRLG